MSSKGFFRSPKAKFGHLKGLSNGAYRLLDVYLHIAVWGDVSTYRGTTNASFRQLQEHYLPTWKSVGTFSRYRRELIEAGLVSVLDDGRVDVQNAEQGFEDAQQAEEQAVSNVEQVVREDERAVYQEEQTVLLAEHKDEGSGQFLDTLSAQNGFKSAAIVQIGEQVEARKEELKTDIKTQVKTVLDKRKAIIDEFVRWDGNQSNPHADPASFIENTLNKYGEDEVLHAMRIHGADTFDGYSHFWKHLRRSECGCRALHGKEPAAAGEGSGGSELPSRKVPVNGLTILREMFKASGLDTQKRPDEGPYAVD